jgi:hypothetical protein
VVGGYFAGNVAEELVKEHLKDPPAHPPGSNTPDAKPEKEHAPGKSNPSDHGYGHEPGGGSGDHNPGTQSSSGQTPTSGQINHETYGLGGLGLGGSVTSADPNGGYNSSGWGGDPYSGTNDGYNGSGWGGDPYTGSAPNPLDGSTGPGKGDTTPKDGTGHNDLVAPIIFDLDGDGIEIIPLNKSSTFFDYNGDGSVGRTAWVGGGDGILVIDLGANGSRTPDGVIN